MGLNFSELEQIDLYKGTTTGKIIFIIFLIHGGGLRFCNKAQKFNVRRYFNSLELEEKIKNWRDDLEITISDGENNERLNANRFIEPG